jgi:hypothetical protein
MCGSEDGVQWEMPLLGIEAERREYKKTNGKDKKRKRPLKTFLIKAPV